MNGLEQSVLGSLTGNIPKAVLCIRQKKEGDSIRDAASSAGRLQKELLKRAKNALEKGAGDNYGASLTFGDLTGIQGPLTGSGYAAMEVQYNPASIYIDTQSGRQTEYFGGDLGSGSNNQLVQVNQPVSSTMSFQLIFDDMNPADAFMAENMAVTAGNIVSAAGSLLRKKKGGGYSVQTQIDGLMALLTQDETRQVIFFWAKMCFRGELTSVSSRYTMFNKNGSPVRGVVDLSIRQGDEPQFGYDEEYWERAFDEAAKLL